MEELSAACLDTISHLRSCFSCYMVSTPLCILLCSSRMKISFSEPPVLGLSAGPENTNTHREVGVAETSFILCDNTSW